MNGTDFGVQVNSDPSLEAPSARVVSSAASNPCRGLPKKLSTLAELLLKERAREPKSQSVSQSAVQPLIRQLADH